MHEVLNFFVCLKLLFEKCFSSNFVYMQGKLCYCRQALWGNRLQCFPFEQSIVRDADSFLRKQRICRQTLSTAGGIMHIPESMVPAGPRARM